MSRKVTDAAHDAERPGQRRGQDEHDALHLEGEHAADHAKHDKRNVEPKGRHLVGRRKVDEHRGIEHDGAGRAARRASGKGTDFTQLVRDNAADDGQHGRDRHDDGRREVDVAHNLVVLDLIHERLHDGVGQEARDGRTDKEERRVEVFVARECEEQADSDRDARNVRVVLGKEILDGLGVCRRGRGDGRWGRRGRRGRGR
mmetsp:Transcript_124609/g.302574  ORF Transcript_124609/g.302574 Transcript_124609/m.302574 type:complete len:201 (+) Transcript_124609:356-958(+)